MALEPNEGAKYEQTRFSIDRDWGEPSFRQYLDWANNTETKALALDIWSRGNYLRYIMSRNTDESPTVIIPFRYIDELRNYYRRMALMDVPAHYVYIGESSSHNKYWCLHPAEDDTIFDGGAGWSIVMTKPIQLGRRKWLSAFGSSKLMPEVFAEWLTSEASSDFARGYAFLSPAELIGIPSGFVEEGIEIAADVTGAVPLSAYMSETELIFNLDLPYIDGMDHATFSKIIQDNDYRLSRFRRAIGKLIKGVDRKDLGDTIAELKDEVAQMQLSDSGLHLRQTISRFGGLFTTVAAGGSAFGASIGKGL
jgi:hypothetical protein